MIFDDFPCDDQQQQPLLSQDDTSRKKDINLDESIGSSTQRTNNQTTRWRTLRSQAPQQEPCNLGLVLLLGLPSRSKMYFLDSASNIFVLKNSLPNHLRMFDDFRHFCVDV